MATSGGLSLEAIRRGVAHHLFEGGQPAHHLGEGGHPQGLHPQPDGLLLRLGRGGAVDHQLLEAVPEGHDLVDGHPAAVAAVGLLSALLAYEIERARELALLRALGMTPGGIAALVETQTTFLGVAAALAAIPTGTMAALVLIDVINRRAFGWHIDFHWSTAEVVQTLALALGAALLAGLYPAWRSSRVAIAASMREE